MRRVLPFFFCIVFLSACVTRGRAVLVSPAEYMELANGYAGLSKYEKALSFYSQARKAPEYRNASEYGMARMYAFLEKWDETVPLLEGLLQRDPKNMIVSSALAYALAAKGEPERAALVYKDLYEINSEDPESGLAYARILLLCEDYQEVLDLSASLREKFPDSTIIPLLNALEKKATDAMTPKEQNLEKDAL